MPRSSLRASFAFMPKNTTTVERFSVAFQGFGDFERSALASFFRLASARTPAYEQIDDAERADFLIADADLASACDAVAAAGRVDETVFVGARAPQGAMAWLRRPIDPVHILRELDALVERSHAVPSLYGDLPELPESPPIDLLLDIDPSFAGASNQPPAVELLMHGHGGHAQEVLVVDDSAIARRFLAQRLQTLGYRVRLAATAEEATELLARHRFAIVFLDVLLGPPGSVDGFQICQSLKQRHTAEGTQADAAVVLVTSLKGSSDRVRGSLAGCNAYLTKPLMEADFIAALQQVDPVFRAA